MVQVEFKAWPKIVRGAPFLVTITEKLDGTNACVIIEDGKLVGCQSRKRLITPENDNFGFATWAHENAEELVKLGDGYHYGEWAGPGIQKNPHCLEEKKFFLFNTFRWGEHNPSTPDCCEVVPVLFNGEMDASTVDKCLEDLKQNATEDQRPEGVIVYYHAFRFYSKHTIIAPNGKWAE